MINYFSWKDFDKSVDFIAKNCKSLNLSGVYGIPRGGLCLAVALSHKLDIELISEPKKNCLIVDDVFETGYTLNSFKNINGAVFFVIISKKDPKWWNTVYLAKSKEWVLFPWEDKKNTLNDKKEYLAKRRSK